MTWEDLTVAAEGTHHIRAGAPAYADRFDEVLAFHSPGLAPVRAAGLAWHIDEDCTPAYARRFFRTFGFYGGVAAVVDDTGWRHIRPDGTDLYPERYAWCGNYQDGRCTVRDASGAYFHLRLDGSRAYHETWRYAGDFRDGIAVVQGPDGCSTHVDRDGRQVHGKWFVDLDVFHKGFARARDECGWMHVDRSGQPIYARRFAAVEPFYNGQSRVERFDRGIEVIDERGQDAVRARDGKQLRPDDWTAVGRFRISMDDVLRRRAWGTIRGATDGSGRSLVAKSTRARHDREYEALGVLRGHPSVPEVAGREQLADSDWLFLERRPGRELGTRNQCVSRPVPVAIEIVDQVLSVCERLHASGLVHTDIHPGNILEEEGRITVLDFEHSVRLDSRGLWSGELNWGVWEFVPPEQLLDFTVLDASADVYSAAVVLAYLVRGQVPFRFKVLETYRAGGWNAVRSRFQELREAPQLDGITGTLRSVIEDVLLVPRDRRPTAVKFRQMLKAVRHE
ncbi:MAG: protein kinase domain-containing protein [Myxococcota bacterium]